MVRREKHVSGSHPLAHKGFEEIGLRTHRGGSWIVDKNPSRWEVRFAMVKNFEAANFWEILVLVGRVCVLGGKKWQIVGLVGPASPTTKICEDPLS